MPAKAILASVLLALDLFWVFLLLWAMIASNAMFERVDMFVFCSVIGGISLSFALGLWRYARAHFPSAREENRVLFYNLIPQKG